MEEGQRSARSSRTASTERPASHRRNEEKKPFKKGFGVSRKNKEIPEKIRREGDRDTAGYENKKRPAAGQQENGRPFRKKEKKVSKKNFDDAPRKSGPVRLNKFLSNAGVASRREADRLIELGLVSVNGVIVRELGLKVDPGKDVVKYDDVKLQPEIRRYILLNKPKDYITTVDDPENRHTVMELVRSACRERIYPVGRLDRNTTGLLLFTNDGELAKRLTHPRSGFPKLYHVETNEKVTPDMLQKMRSGVPLEDGIVQADEAEYVGEGEDPRQVGIRLHSGKNRVVRRIFEHLGLTIKKLDRVMFAGLTKKDLPRGRYRHLSEREVNFLKMVR
ncbi:MAG: rRNA pseudouridine synthase [Crocinitomicaceae bacterium]|nr:rRNA pseudouridine synthase [Crocinitomicaceae bacterium]